MDFVKIGGEKRPYKFGFKVQWVIREVLGLNEKNFSDSEEDTNPADYAYAVVYACLKVGAKREKKDFPFAPEDIEDWIDETSEGMAAAEVIVSGFNLWGNPPPVENGEAKKKLKKAEA